MLQICRQRERVAKAQVEAVAAGRKADFQAQLARVYDWDETNLGRPAKEAQQATRECNARIAAKCDALRIRPGRNVS